MAQIIPIPFTTFKLKIEENLNLNLLSEANS